MEQGYRSELQERALIVSLQMFNHILERGVSVLKTQFENNESTKLIVDEDMQILLPAIKVFLLWTYRQEYKNKILEYTENIYAFNIIFHTHILSI